MKRVILSMLLCASVACSPTGRSVDSERTRLVRIGVLPDQAKEVLAQRYAPLVEYLAATAEVEVQLRLPESYEALLEAFEERSIELGWFGALTFLRAERESGAEPLVSRDIDLSFTTAFVTSSGATGRSIGDFVGRRFSFGPRLSTSGHLMPRYLLYQLGIDPETFFSEVRYSQAHDQTVLWAANNEVDLGAVNSTVHQAMLLDGRLEAGKVRVVGQTPPYTNYTWAVQPHLGEEVRSRLLDAFLSLDRTMASHRAVLDPVGAGGFVPVSVADYDELRIAANLLDEPGR